MFKLLKTFLEPKAKSDYLSKSDRKLLVKQDDNFESQLKQADDFRQKGQLKEAISFYTQTIESTNPVPVTPGKLSVALQHNHNLSLAYEKLAAAYKQKGEVEQAANFYRQAIVLKSLNCQQPKQPFQNELQKRLPKTDLHNAFTFQPLLADYQSLRLVKSNSAYASIAKRANQINPQQKLSIEWEAAQVYLQQALDYCDRNLWQQAAIACQQAIQLSPHLAEAYKIWGNALQRMNKTAEAMDCYAKAVEIQPDLAEVYGKVAYLYFVQNKWQQAIDYYQKAIIIKPDFIEAYQNLAQIWQQLDRPEQAQVYHSKFLELQSLTNQSTSGLVEPILPNVNLLSQSVIQHQEIAKKLEQESKWQEAAYHYRQALELNLSQFQSSSEKQLVANSFDNDSRTSQFTKLQQIQSLLRPSSDVTSDRYSEIKSASQKTQSPTKQTDKAIKRYQKQAQLQPNSAKIQLDLGNLYAKQQQWQTAINCYQKAIKIDYQCAEAYWQLAHALEKIGNIAESLERRYQALSLKIDLASASEHTVLGDSLQQQGNLEQAVVCYRRAIGLEPQFILAYRRLGQILSVEGKHQEALACYRQAVQYEPNNAELYFLFAQALAEEKQWHQAVRAYRRVLELQPTYPQASYRLNHALAEKLKLDLQNYK